MLSGSPRRCVELGKAHPCELLGRALAGGHSIMIFLKRCERL